MLDHNTDWDSCDDCGSYNLHITNEDIYCRECDHIKNLEE